MSLFFNPSMWLSDRGKLYSANSMWTFTTGARSRAFANKSLAWGGYSASQCWWSVTGIYADWLTAASLSPSWGWVSYDGKSRSPAHSGPRCKPECKRAFTHVAAHKHTHMHLCKRSAAVTAGLMRILGPINSSRKVSNQWAFPPIRQQTLQW